MAREKNAGGLGAEKGGRPSPSGAKIKAEHEVNEGESLSGIALKYYGSAEEEKWMKIYDRNKQVIGDDPNMIRPGMHLQIPELD